MTYWTMITYGILVAAVFAIATYFFYRAGSGIFVVTASTALFGICTIVFGLVKQFNLQPQNLP